MAEEPGKELTRVGEYGEFTIPSQWGFKPVGTEYLTSLNQKNPDEAALIFRCMAEPGEDVNGYINKEIELVHFLVGPAEWVDDMTGEERKTLVTRLITAEGNIIETHSKGIIKTLMLYANTVRKPPYHPPAKCQIVSQPLKGEKRWLILKFTGFGIKAAIPSKPGQTKTATPKP